MAVKPPPRCAYHKFFMVSCPDCREELNKIFRADFKKSMEEAMKLTPCGCDSYGGTCPACLAKQNRMATCKHGHTGNCQLCLAELVKKEPYLGIFPKTDSALATQIGGEHYKDCKIQPVQFIEANALQFLEGNVLKRITRHNKPTGKGRQDIEKAIHELQLLLELRYPTASSGECSAPAGRP